MDKKIKKQMLSEQLKVMEAASQVLLESHRRVDIILKKNNPILSIEEKESCEALTARFARLCDFLFQRMFRTLDVVELADEGTAIDRLNRMEKRGIISSAQEWKELRELRNQIAHEYLIDKSDRVLQEAFAKANELIKTAENIREYVLRKGLA